MPNGDYLHGVETLEQIDGGQIITTVSTSVIGIVGTAKDAVATTFPLNKPVLVTKPQDLTDLGQSGTLPAALMGIFAMCQTLIIVVRVDDGADINATITNAAGSNVDNSGVYALVTAENQLTYKPKILLCPFLTSKVLTDNKPNAVTTNLFAVADTLRAVALVDGPNTTMADAIATATNTTSTAGRGYMVDPYYIPTFNIPDPTFTSLPSSPLIAGLMAYTDNTDGFWQPLSARVVNKVTNLNRPIGFGLSDKTCEANLLNAASVGTIVFTNGSYMAWGNKSLSKDPNWQFLNVRRVADTVYDSIEANILWALKLTFSKVLLDTIESNVQNYLNRLKVQGALLGGKVWIDKSVNSIAELINGHCYVDFDFEPPAPVERITFRAYRNPDYYNEVFANQGNN